MVQVRMQRLVAVMDCKREILRTAQRPFFRERTLKIAQRAWAPQRGGSHRMIGLATGVISNVGQSGSTEAWLKMVKT